MNEYDYSIYYKRFHDDSEAHAVAMSEYILSVIAPHIPSDPKVPTLDIGCGFGFALRALRTRGFSNLQGLESSAQQAKRCTESGFKVTVVDGDKTIEWIDKHEGQFGLVLLLDVLEHVPAENQISLLRSIYRSLAPAGRLIVTVPNANSLLAARWRYNDYTHFSSFTEHSLYFVLKNAAFNQIDIDSEKGLNGMPKRFWKPQWKQAFRRWLVRWCWLQVFKAELPWERLDRISFELNLKAVATKS